MSPIGNLARLRTFVMDLAELLDSHDDEAMILTGAIPLLKELVARDDWLPEAFAVPAPDRYSQYLLHCDSRERFSVVSFVWGPGQSTRIHDHRTWGLIGMLRGAERCESWSRAQDGHLFRSDQAHILAPGEVDQVSPRVGDIHRVYNALADRPSISIHVYGANIGRVLRASYDDGGEEKPFVSGYSNTVCPNFWGE